VLQPTAPLLAATAGTPMVLRVMSSAATTRCQREAASKVVVASVTTIIRFTGLALTTEISSLAATPCLVPWAVSWLVMAVAAEAATTAEAAAMPTLAEAAPVTRRTRSWRR